MVLIGCELNAVRSRQIYFPIAFSPHWCHVDDDTWFLHDNWYKFFDNNKRKDNNINSNNTKIAGHSAQKRTMSFGQNAVGTWCGQDYDILVHASDLQILYDATNSTSAHVIDNEQLTFSERILAFGNVNVFWAPDRGIVRAFSADPLTLGACRTKDQRCHEAKKLMEQSFCK